MSSDNSIQLVRRIRSEYVIRIDRRASEVEHFAAEELQRYLEQISGVRLPIVARGGRRRAVLVGSVVGWRAELQRKPPDAFLIKTEGSQLLLAGGCPRATLYAVYAFLEDVLGCAWLKPGEDHVPQRTDISVGPLHILQSPDFTVRMLVHFPCVAARILPKIDWMAKRRLNELFLATNNDTSFFESDEYGRRILPEIRKRGLAVRGTGHAFFAWLPPSRYAGKHPEYYALIDGRRNPATSLCISNPAVAAEVARNMGIFSDAHPEFRTITLWHNDHGDWCQCAGCRSWQASTEYCESFYGALLHGKETSRPARHPVLTAAEMRFVNRVAAQVAKTHPHLRIETLAYGSNQRRSVTCRPRANVQVGFATFDKLLLTENARLPLISVRHRNNTTAKYLQEWREQTGRLYVYEYFSLFHDFSPIWDAMVADFRLYRRHGIREISTESAIWNELHMLLYAQLAWNSRLSIDRTLRKFCGAAYGTADTLLFQFWQTLRRAGLPWNYDRAAVATGKISCAKWNRDRRRNPRWKLVEGRCLSLLDQAVELLRKSPLNPDSPACRTETRALDRVRQLRSCWTEPCLPWWG